MCYNYPISLHYKWLGNILKEMVAQVQAIYFADAD